MISCQKKFFQVFVLIMFCSSFFYGQNASNEPALIPLTEDEKKVDPKSVVENQPDFTAIESYFSARDISGFSSSSKVARKGNKYRTDTGFVVVITELNKPNLRLNQDKTLEEGVGNRKSFVSATSPLNPTDLLGFADISFASLGTIDIDKNKLLKIQAKSKEFNQEVFLYADLGKKNLITIVQILGSNRSSIQRLNEISFDVPNQLFDISEYKSKPKFNWTKIKTAKIVYRGENVKDGVAFRHGKYIFIHAGEFDHMLIDVDKKTALTVVYRGLLLSKEGYLIWQTKDEEAVSIGNTEDYFSGENEYSVKIDVTSNSVTIPDRENKNKVLAKITW